MTNNTSNNVKRRKGYDILPKILCFIGAFVLWLYVTQVETIDYEETFNGVTVELINTSALESESGLRVYSGHGNTVNVTVSGRKSDINRYTSENIYVFADVSEIKESGRHTLPISIETPSGLTVSKMSVSFINVYVDVTSTIEVDIVPKYSSAYTLPVGYELDKVDTEYSFISVTGPRAVLNEIDFAQISLELGNLNSTVSKIVPIELISKSGEPVDMRYIQLNRDVVKATIYVYTTKEVPINVEFKNKNKYYNENNVSVTYEPETILLKGDPQTLENISSVQIEPIDEQTILTDEVRNCRLKLPSDIESVDNIESVDVTIKHIGTTVRSFPVDKFEVKGDGTVVTKSLTVQIRGTKEELDKISKDDVKATVDISDFGASVSGTFPVTATINISGNYSSVYSVGEYTVQVKID